MTVLRRFMPVALVAAMGGGGVASCGGDSTGPKAGSVTGIFGDNGAVVTGDTLSVGFTVLGADGFPLRGARVTWAVAPITAASVTPASQTSDTAGVAATLVTVGTTVGAFTITATVSGVAPITFHITALDPCQALAVYALGDTVFGALKRTDCRIAAGTAHYYYDFYALTLPAGQHSIRITETSSGPSKLDPYVELYRQTGPLLGWDDDSVPGIAQNSQLDVILGDGGAFVLAATSYDPDTIGPYTLATAPRATSLAGCQDVWMTPGATFTDTIRATDCGDSTGHFDRIYMYMQGSDVIKIAERSTVLNSLLTLYNANFTLGRFDSVAANDDSATGNPNAYISYTVPVNGWYLLKIGGAAPGDTGEYTLAFSSSVTGPTRPKPGAPLDRVLPLLPSRAFRGWKKPS
jgi:hypothetical protein